mgnify:CR=1 FL=1
MKILQFKIEIKASPATVWNALWAVSYTHLTLPTKA